MAMILDEDYYKKIFSKNLKKYMQMYDKSQTDLIEDLGLNRSSVSTWVNGTRLPRMDKVDMLANYEESFAVKIPILGTVVAGMPISAYEDILEYEEITPEMAQTGEFYALKVKGNSMEPRICEGDVVIVKVQPDVECGDIAVVIVNGDEATVKKISKSEEGITLIANNPAVYTLRIYYVYITYILRIYNVDKN